MPRTAKKEEPVSVCIVCAVEKGGIPVLDDPIINSIRWLKQKLGRATNRKLVVCERCIPAYEKRRGRFTSSLKLWGAIAAILFIFTAFLSFTITGIFLALIFSIFIFLTSLVNYYPGIEKKLQGR